MWGNKCTVLSKFTENSSETTKRSVIIDMKTESVQQSTEKE